MSRNGSGTYTLPAGNPVVTGTTISSTWANNTLTDIATALTGSLAADGQTPMTGALNMNSNKVTAVTDPTNAQDAATKNYTDAAITTATSGLGAIYLAKANNLSDVINASTSRTNLGLGTIATQAASSVAITGGAIDATTIGTTTPSSVKTNALTVTGATSGTLAIAATAVAGTNTATFPATTGTVMVSGNMPAFSVTNNNSAQTVSNATFTKVILNTKDFDTATAFDATTNYRFTPQVAGYYQINSFVSGPASNTQNQITAIYKNGSIYKFLGAVSNLNATSQSNNGESGAMLLYLNGSTDYIELWVFQQSGGSANTCTNAYLNGFLARTA